MENMPKTKNKRLSYDLRVIILGGWGGGGGGEA